jgi:hypothetical protein
MTPDAAASGPYATILLDSRPCQCRGCQPTSNLELAGGEASAGKMPVELGGFQSVPRSS